jgi:hypothetical protein
MGEDRTQRGANKDRGGEYTEGRQECHREKRSAYGGTMSDFREERRGPKYVEQDPERKAHRDNSTVQRGYSFCISMKHIQRCIHLKPM